MPTGGSLRERRQSNEAFKLNHREDKLSYKEVKLNHKEFKLNHKEDKLTYKEAVTGRSNLLDGKSAQSPEICSDEKSMGAIMNRDLENSFQAPVYLANQCHSAPPKRTGTKWLGKNHTNSDVKTSRWGPSPSRWEVKSPKWPDKEKTNRQMIERDQSASLCGQDPKQGALDDRAGLPGEFRGSLSSSSRKYVSNPTATNGGRPSSQREFREAFLPPGDHSEGTDKNFFPLQKNDASFERKHIPVVSVKMFDEEEENLSSNQNEFVPKWTGGFPNKKTVFFFPKTLSLPNYTFDMVYYQDTGKFADTTIMCRFCIVKYLFPTNLHTMHSFSK